MLIGHRIKYSSCIHTGRIKWQSNYLDLHENNLSGGGRTQDGKQSYGETRCMWEEELPLICIRIYLVSMFISLSQGP